MSFPRKPQENWRSELSTIKKEINEGCYSYIYDEPVQLENGWATMLCSIIDYALKIKIPADFDNFQPPRSIDERLGLYVQDIYDKCTVIVEVAELEVEKEYIRDNLKKVRLDLESKKALLLNFPDFTETDFSNLLNFIDFLLEEDVPEITDLGDSIEIRFETFLAIHGETKNSKVLEYLVAISKCYSK
jgi:hypothetical protein